MSDDWSCRVVRQLNSVYQTEIMSSCSPKNRDGWQLDSKFDDDAVRCTICFAFKLRIFWNFMVGTSRQDDDDATYIPVSKFRLVAGFAQCM